MSASSLVVGSMEVKTEWCKKETAKAPHLVDMKNIRWCLIRVTCSNPNSWPSSSMTSGNFPWELAGASQVENKRDLPFGVKTTGIQWPSTTQAESTITPFCKISGWSRAQAWQSCVPCWTHPVSNKGSSIIHSRSWPMIPSNLLALRISSKRPMWWRISSSDQTSSCASKMAPLSSAFKNWCRSAHRCLVFCTTGTINLRNCSPFRPKRGAAEIQDSQSGNLAEGVSHWPASKGPNEEAWNWLPLSTTGCDHWAVGLMVGRGTSCNTQPSDATWAPGMGSNAAAGQTGDDAGWLTTCSASHEMYTTWPTCKAWDKESSWPSWSQTLVTQKLPTNWEWAWMSLWMVSPSETFISTGLANSCWKTTTHPFGDVMTGTRTCKGGSYQGVGSRSCKSSSMAVMATSSGTGCTGIGKLAWYWRMSKSITAATETVHECNSGHRKGLTNSGMERSETLPQNFIRARVLWSWIGSSWAGHTCRPLMSNQVMKAWSCASALNATGNPRMESSRSSNAEKTHATCNGEAIWPAAANVSLGLEPKSTMGSNPHNIITSLGWAWRMVLGAESVEHDLTKHPNKPFSWRRMQERPLCRHPHSQPITWEPQECKAQGAHVSKLSKYLKKESFSTPNACFSTSNKARACSSPRSHGCSAGIKCRTLETMCIRGHEFRGILPRNGAVINHQARCLRAGQTSSNRNSHWEQK